MIKTKMHCCFWRHETYRKRKTLSSSPGCTPQLFKLAKRVIQKYIRSFSASSNLDLILDRNNEWDRISFSSFFKKSFQIFGPR